VEAPILHGTETGAVTGHSVAKNAGKMTREEIPGSPPTISAPTIPTSDHDQRKHRRRPLNWGAATRQRTGTPVPCSAQNRRRALPGGSQHLDSTGAGDPQQFTCVEKETERN